ncbi:NAC domain-containing protein 22-like [Solanum lycopersicum]|uniref:NAC domain-containing protein n=1 Tax=Solanum lycopersicum TaxID=4081 RepID=A0A3Q7ECE5_SOLLC|nr:NAC domain-containing protein 78-like [Solanum lycopersicum]
MGNLKEGFRFSPTDAEAVTFLLRFIAGKFMNDSGFITTHVDTYGKQEPWDIYSHGVACSNDDEDNDCSQYRFFITKLKKKSESRYSRDVGNKGSWKQQDKSKSVRRKGGPVIGYKKSMSYMNKGYNKKNGDWLMKEYTLPEYLLDKFDKDCRDYVLCSIKKRTRSKTQTKEKLKLVNIVPEESTNLEDQSSATVGSTSFTEELQGRGVDAGGYLPQLELQNEMHEGTSIFVETLPAPFTFEPTSMLDFDYQYLPADFDFLRSITA